MPYARSQGLRMHYQVEGDGPPLVFQHGFGDGLESWYELGYVDALKDEYRLILIDARGHGASDKPHDPEAYRFQNVTADVVTVLDDLAISKAHYFGFSMGGKNGFATAAYAPDRLRSLIVLGTGASAQDHGPLDFWIASLRRGPEAVPSIWERDAPVSPALRQRLLSNDLEALIAHIPQLWEEKWQGSDTRREANHRLSGVGKRGHLPLKIQTPRGAQRSYRRQTEQTRVRLNNDKKLTLDQLTDNRRRVPQ